MVDDVRSHFRFGLQRVVLFTVPVDNADFIGIVTEARTFVIQRIKHDKIQVLTVQFIFRIMLFVIGFEGKAHQHLAGMLLLHLAQMGGDVPCRLQVQ